jgi:probable phosphoglycerate mutase
VRQLPADPVLRGRYGSIDGTLGRAAARIVIVAYIDGGARGNPGPAGYGVRIERADATLVEEFCDSIGIATNNVAEYRGLLAALEWAKARGEHEVHVRSDSLLLVQQMKGVYKVKNDGLRPLHAKAQQLSREIGRVTFEHVGRSSNANADRLANAAMDEAARP